MFQHILASAFFLFLSLAAYPTLRAFAMEYLAAGPGARLFIWVILVVIGMRFIWRAT